MLPPYAVLLAQRYMLGSEGSLDCGSCKRFPKPVTCRRFRSSRVNQFCTGDLLANEISID